MSASCPSCHGKLPALSVRTSFVCPLCQAPLRSNLRMVLPVALVVGGGAEFALLRFLEAQLGGLAVAVWAWLFVGGFSALAVYSLVVRFFVQLRAEA